MGQTFDITLLGDVLAGPGNAVAHMLERFERTLERVELLGVSTWRGTTSERKAAKWPESREHIKSLVEQVGDTPERVQLELSLSVEDEPPFWFDIFVNGSRFSFGKTRAVHGSINCVCASSAFSRSSPTVLEAGEPLPTGPLPLRKQTPSTWSPERAAILFATLVGLESDNHAFCAPHAVFYPEGAVPDPWTAFMVYHQDASDFGRDFLLMRERYVRGGTAPAYYSESVDIPEQWDGGGGRPRNIEALAKLNNREAYFSQFDGLSGAEAEEFFQVVSRDVSEMHDVVSSDAWCRSIEKAASEAGVTWLRSANGTGGAVVTPIHRDGLPWNLLAFYRCLWSHWSGQLR